MGNEIHGGDIEQPRRIVGVHYGRVTQRMRAVDTDLRGKKEGLGAAANLFDQGIEGAFTEGHVAIGEPDPIRLASGGRQVTADGAPEKLFGR